MYYLVGQRMDLRLFERNSVKRFLILILFLAIITEVVQLWIPARVFNMFDLIFNFAGVAIGIAVIKIVGRKKEQIQSE